jgi:hypothetical protein
MNKDETKKAIEVMQAYVDGADIEYQQHDTPLWTRLVSDRPAWNWNQGNFRIKPKPREWCMMVMGDGRLRRREEEGYLGRVIKVVEVL